MTAVQTYLSALKKLSATGLTTEHSFRSPLETLINTLDKRFMAVNEPKRQACGAPDYVVLNTSLTSPLSVGYIEAKDVWVSLDNIEETGQFRRYIRSLDNLILTNYLEFRRFVRGGKVASAVLGECRRDKTLELYSGKENDLQSFLRDFLDFPTEPVASARELAVRMAKLTHAIRDVVLAALDSPWNANLEAWREAFARTLIPDLMTNERKTDFADMYAQTIAYGFFAARCHHDAGKGEFERKNAQDDIPKTNPLLRSLFVNLTGPDLKDEPYFQFVEDLVQLLSAADMRGVLKDFGEHDKRADPVIHFYETFLAAYDPELREKRGVYYTPEPVVSWLVRSADAVLRDKFSIPQGLADNSVKVKAINAATGAKTTLPKVLILDPACGTGTFLYETIALIRDRLTEQGQCGAWSAFVRENLLPRIFGFELLMAPYAVAHFKLGMQLAGYDMPGAEHNPWAYDFSSAERLKVFLTNTLEELENAIEMNLPGLMKALSDEGRSAREIKGSLPVLVIMGNPPYSGESANASMIRVPTGKYRHGKPILKTVRTLIGRLVDDYKQIDGVSLGEANPKWLQDDYVKFIRWAQWKLEARGEGVVAFVTNHGYLDNPTFRGMRWSLLRSFDEIYVYDLHGNTRKKERAPDGSPDQNVFDIQQGVALLVLVKLKDGDRNALAKIYHAEIYGSREDKYKRLFDTDIGSTEWEKLTPGNPDYLFIPQHKILLDEYDRGSSITEIFSVYSVGIATARDKLTIHFTPEDVWNTVNRFISIPPEEARSSFSLGKDTRDWKVALAQADIRRSGPDKKYIQKILYRPFDVRYTYYTGRTRGFICRPRLDVMKMVINKENIGLSTTRGIEIQNKWSHVFCSTNIIQLHTVSLKEVNYFFPLFNGDNSNINGEFINKIKAKIGYNISIDNMFYYIYSIFHSNIYIDTYENFLRNDFPKVPLPKSKDYFLHLAKIGRELVSLHALTHQALSVPSNWITKYPVADNSETADSVARQYPSYVEGKITINSKQFFSGVPEGVWNYTIGGYQPAQKWLKDRRGRKLSLEDIQTYQKIILSLSETIRLRKELDVVWKA
jgi:predicted helicase